MTHKKLVEHTRDELMQFPELARKYLVNLFILLLELRKSPEYMTNANSIIGQFKSRGYFEKIAKIENFDAIFLSVTNGILMASTFTDEEAKELYDMLCSLDESSLRSYLTSNGVVISSFFPSWNYEIAWKVLSLRTCTLPVIEAFQINREKPNLLEFLESKKQPGEILSSVGTSEICFYSLKKSDGIGWRYHLNIFPNPLTITYFISVLEQ
ncbi:MAG: hypothetical protein WC842_00705 [Candidatus Paceibacterota bacterium]